jgi:hypothetical protein
MFAGDGAPRSLNWEEHIMHLIRYALATLACAFIGAASASTVTLQLTDLTYSAYSLNPLGGSAAVGLSHDPYHVVGNLLGTREQQHEESSWSHGASMYLSGDSTLPGNYARAYGFWNSNVNGQLYDIRAGAEVAGSLSQWYFAESLLDTSATLTLTPNSVAVVSGHLAGTSEFDGADAQAVFSMLLEGGGNFSVYERVFGTGSALSAVNDFFTLTLFNRTDQALDLNWKLDVGLTASRAIPPIPEPLGISMVLAGLLVFAMPHAACVLRRQRIREKYPAARLQ